ncbi:MAG: cellobiose phosphorylase [Candidatus Omnitrophica bacterium]|nr:cellobiose phosphorylase [Candidatus Omnitrophota bacterium]
MDYSLLPDGRFVIRNFQQKKPFSNFLPGIAGLYGTPMWVFSVNRGQGIASFGTKNKDNAILEFFPANKAYQMTPSVGFRTFVKIIHDKRALFYEPFGGVPEADVERRMETSSHELRIEETNLSSGLKVEVRYFTVPGEPLAVLAREMAVSNISKQTKRLEILDGLPSVNPYGMNEFFVKQMSRTIEAWMIVENLSRKVPYFRLKVDAADRPEVVPIREGNFYFSGIEGRGGTLEGLDPIVDPAEIFGPALDFSRPQAFLEKTPFRFPEAQMRGNKLPCAFSLAHLDLPAGKTRKVISYYGQANSQEILNRFVTRARSAFYFEKKGEENRRLIEGIKGRIFTATASPVYDLYCGQTYLDNVIRGGLPVVLDRSGGFVSYVYSRKHGDLERDYNRFLVEPAYFAQGDGNYRDVNQNRRSDVWFEPRVRDLNIRTFLGLIQLDGFNPLVLKGAEFHFHLSKTAGDFLRKIFKLNAARLGECAGFFERPFTLGELYRFLEERKLVTPALFRRFLEEAGPFLSREDRAEHGEGFWTDHWTYNLDLIENFLAIYPEEKERLLFLNKDHTFYDNSHRVRPRAEKYFLKDQNQLRQYSAVVEDKEKERLLGQRRMHARLVRTRGGRGEIYRTTLFVKLLCLFANKLASLDAHGVGIEMEADKPSWYDALNGLPGLLGSSLPETFELKRLAVFMLQSLEPFAAGGPFAMPAELQEFISKLNQLLKKHFNDRGSDKDFVFWDAATGLKEKFRAETFSGLSGKEKKISPVEVKAFLEHAREKIDMGLEKAYDAKNQMVPTYFRNEGLACKVRDKARQSAFPARFEQTPLPLFLEGPVHALKVEKDPERRKRLVKAVRSSALHDEKLSMYKVNAPMESAPLQIGRARVFAPGWMENESVWLHMEYKFILEILKSGMAEEFFKDFRKVLIPFQPAERYGRSILENSSFLVSSAFCDRSLHGAGFVARLSGSTAEFLSMWLLMNVGKHPFILSPDGKICLRFEPQLPAFLFLNENTERSFFDKEENEVKVKLPKNSLAFLFLSKTLVVVHNPKRLDTFGNPRVAVKKISLTDRQGRVMDFKGDTIPHPHALKVRDEFVPRIDIELG